MTRAATGWLGLAWLARRPAVVRAAATAGSIGWLGATRTPLRAGLSRASGAAGLAAAAASPLVLPFLALAAPRADRASRRVWPAAAARASPGLRQGFAIGIAGRSARGWRLARRRARSQFGIGCGALLAAALSRAASPRASRGAACCGGDAFVVGDDRASSSRLVAAVHLLSGAAGRCSQRRARPKGTLRAAAFVAKRCRPPTSGASAASRGGTRCGVAWNTLLLAVARRRAVTTLLGLVFALVVPHGVSALRALLQVMSILPIITPPFVIGARARRAVRPHRASSPAGSTTGSASRARAGSTACRA